jgi:hypothetical protein
MKTIKNALKPRLASVSVLVLVSLLVPVCAMAQIPGVPNVVSADKNKFQQQTHFLTFVGSYIGESAASAKAYYKAIDPNNTKATFPQWLVKAGFIQNEGQWHAFGKQKIACGLGPASGCDYPAGTYGDNIVNTDSHAIVLNAADLGFVRNQFIRCVDPANPNSTSPCTAKNPIIYTYLENYPVTPFAPEFTVTSGFPTQAEAKIAINHAINRPLGTSSSNTSDNPTNPVVFCTDPKVCVERIADVAFEWAPPATNPTSSTRFGQLYAYIFAHDPTCNANSAHICETTDFPAAVFGIQLNGLPIVNFVAGDGSTVPIVAPTVPPAAPVPPPFDKFAPVPPPFDKFAPNLDGVGFKQHPGLCLVCHGGAPANLTSSGAYPRGGNINGFRFLPLDIRNLLFTSDLDTTDPLSRISQEPQIKEYNLAVLRTVPKYAETDDQGVTRIPHLREVVQGWYSTGDNYSNDTSMSASIQKSDWIPKGWRDTTHGGTAPVGAEDVYTHVVGPSCRSCHFNRELSLDFGTYANFHQESDLQQLALIAQCKTNNPDPGAKFMPLAFLTFNRFWQTQDQPQQLPPPPAISNFVLDHEVDRLAESFGFPHPGVDSYCGTNP